MTTPTILVSVDPGSVNCAVVRYNLAHDRIEAAELINFMCNCHAGPEAANTTTVHDLPARVCYHIDNSPFFASVDSDAIAAVVIERQMPQSIENMLVAATISTRFYPRTSTMAPTEVRRFWSTKQPASFRSNGSYSANKTDSRRLASRVFRPDERAILYRAAKAHATHRLQCNYSQARVPASPSARNRRRCRTIIKIDDLTDAGLQAICAANLRFGTSIAQRMPSMIQSQLEPVRAKTKKKRGHKRPSPSEPAPIDIISLD